MSYGLLGEDDEELSGSENEESLFDEDMEALRRACLLTGTDMPAPSTSDHDASVDADSDDDLQLVRSIQSRFSISSDLFKPLAVLPPAGSDGEEDDFETLRAIQRRFSAYDHDTLDKGQNGLSIISLVSNVSGSASEEEVSNTVLSGKTDSCRVFPDNKDACDSADSLNNNKDSGPTGLLDWHPLDVDKPSVESYKCSTFPKSAQVFVDAIRKNRSSQKLLRSKLIQIDARIEETKKLKERVKILKDFQVSCRKRTGQSLSQKKDPRVQLISTQHKPKKSKGDDKKLSAIYYGPAENCHVANYRLALMRFPLELHRNKWKEAEKENLFKGIKQQFQEMVFRVSVENFSSSNGDALGFEDLLASIKDIEISPEEVRKFLPKVNWNQVASMYLPGRSGAECEARWLNWEDPLINHARWTIDEDKHLLLIIQEKGINDWVDIAVSLGTNRTPFQCLARYQRSLNPCILRREWTPEEDVQLRAAVETYGESDWQTVASTLGGRTGTQCSNRWKKTLHPERKRVGRWSKDEDRRLIVAATLFGPKNWRKICQFVPGRTHVQCRERWVNSLDPSLNMDKWTAEEDAKLEAAISEHGYCWSKIAACVPPRTDSQCRRRWKVLFPQEVPLLQQAKKIQRMAFISNFVDRESERPSLSPNDFLLLPPADPASTSEPERTDPPSKQERKPRKRAQPSAKGGARVSNKLRSKKQKTSNEDEAAPAGPPDASEARSCNGDGSDNPSPDISEGKKSSPDQSGNSPNSNNDKRGNPPPDISDCGDHGADERDSPPLDISDAMKSSGYESDCTLAWFIENRLKKLPIRRHGKHWR
ncbi:snRNA-activating protein complex subunit 4 [Punica granatum]|uniref:snRNA-activating protein complex subunit 4 n=1 Tax=Punica granatum TaxID=22663 RepID=A0A218VQL0_PUNGR|nr:snRNA-activating protein complex subunit 4 [Punica granatum]OWM62626.1 hypothetical protein CDL15_Pgr019920 [Punica granatum]